MPGPRVFTAVEVDELLPRVERQFARLDAVRAELKALHLRVSALEMIWGARVREHDNPDHAELAHHLDEMKRLQAEFERCTKQVERLGGQVKSTEPALVDFYGVRDGRLVFWCWTRGETRIEHWHHVDEGFGSRQKV